MWRQVLALLAVASVGLVSAQDAAGDLAALQAFAAGITNFQQVLASPGFYGWDSSPPCPAAGRTWTGVICSPDGRVVQLLFNQALGAQGTLAAGLSGLTALTMLDLSNNQFSGSLPAAWASGFPALQQLYIRANSLGGPLPAAWGAPGAFPALQEIDLFQNAITGSLPDSWGASTSFPALIKLGFESNQLGGTLPVAWGTSNGLQLLKSLDLKANALTGSLPCTWSLPALNIFTLEQNMLTGCLCSTYPTQLPMLQSFTVYSNQLSGAVPTSYGNWASLTTLGLFPPGNTGLCGTIPANVITNTAVNPATPRITPAQLSAFGATASGGGSYALPMACSGSVCNSTPPSPAVTTAAQPAVLPAQPQSVPQLQMFPSVPAPAPGPGQFAGAAPLTAPGGQAAPGSTGAVTSSGRKLK